MEVHSLRFYPIKSCAGIEVDSWPLEARGLAHDRSFMVVTPDGVALTQRKCPRLATVVPRVVDNALSISTGAATTTVALTAGRGSADADGSRQSTPSDTATAVKVAQVWGYRAPVEDAGEEAAQLLSTHLRTAVRLVRMPADYSRQADQASGSGGTPVSFSDGFPLLVTTTASLDALNERLLEPVPMDRFRPNIVVAGSLPWLEDRWTQIQLRGADTIRMDLVKPCTRCAITTVDQQRGCRCGPEPLRTLAVLRRSADGVEFGWNAVHRDRGIVRVGDQVTATLRPAAP